MKKNPQSRYYIFVFTCLLSSMLSLNSYANNEKCNALFTSERQKLVTSAQGDEFQFSARNSHGKTEVLKGKRQLELERRSNLTLPMEKMVTRIRQDQDPADPKFKKKSINREPVNELVVLKNAEDLIREILSQDWAQNIQVAPLGSHSEKWHGDGGIGEAGSVKEIDFYWNDFSTVIESELIGKSTWMGENWELFKSKYIVGKQYEESYYFDTANDDYAKQKIALRKKIWYAADDAEMSKPRHAMFFLKRSYSGLNEIPEVEKRNVKLGFSDLVKNYLRKFGNKIADHFTYRLELQVPIDEKVERIPVGNLLKSLASSILPRIGTEQEIYAKKKVENLRHGLNLNYMGKKIGFMTIDTYTVKTLDPSGGEVSVGEPIFQFEYEIFPDHYKTYKENIGEFEYFFQNIEKYFNANNVVTPKYQH